MKFKHSIFISALLWLAGVSLYTYFSPTFGIESILNNADFIAVTIFFTLIISIFELMIDGATEGGLFKALCMLALPFGMYGISLDVCGSEVVHASLIKACKLAGLVILFMVTVVAVHYARDLYIYLRFKRKRRCKA